MQNCYLNFPSCDFQITPYLIGGSSCHWIVSSASCLSTNQRRPFFYCDFINICLCKREFDKCNLCLLKCCCKLVSLNVYFERSLALWASFVVALISRVEIAGGYYFCGVCQSNVNMKAHMQMGRLHKTALRSIISFSSTLLYALKLRCCATRRDSYCNMNYFFEFYWIEIKQQNTTLHRRLWYF